MSIEPGVLSRDAKLTMAINISARQLRYPELVGEVEDALRQAALEPGSLTLEPFPKRLAPWEPGHQATGFRIRGAAHQIVHRPVSNREAHPFRETL